MDVDLADNVLLNMDLADLPALAVAVPAVASHLRAHPLRDVLPTLLVLRRPWVELIWVALLQRRTPLLGWLLRSERCRSEATQFRAQLLALARATGQVESARLIVKSCGDSPPVESGFNCARIEVLGPVSDIVVCVTDNYSRVVLEDGVIRAHSWLSGGPPIAIPGLHSVKVSRMSCGSEFIVVLTHDGSVMEAEELGPFHHLDVAAATDVAVGPVSSDSGEVHEDCRYALDADGRIWCWGRLQGGIGFPGLGIELGIDTDDPDDQLFGPLAISHTYAGNGSMQDCPVFKELAAGDSVLAAVSISNRLFACGANVNEEDRDAPQFWNGTRNPSASWMGLLAEVGTPAPVRSVLATRESPSISYFWDENGGSWRPDFHGDDWGPLVPAPDEIMVKGLLALLADGTVFAALQQARVPGLRGIVGMYECGDAVAFLRRDGQLLVHNPPDLGEFRWL